MPKFKDEKRKDLQKINKDLVPNEFVEQAGVMKKDKRAAITAYNRSMARLEENVDLALDRLFELVEDEDKYVALRAVEIILKKVVPERKIKEIVGPDGGPVQVNQNIDQRSMVFNVINHLDTFDYDELKRRALDGGNITVLEPYPGEEEPEEEGMD